MTTSATVCLIPCSLSENVVEPIAPYILDHIKKCDTIFAENERTARRFFKLLDKSIVIDDFEWYTIHKAEAEVLSIFREKIMEGRQIGIISEAGCPGVADPGQILVEEAQKLEVNILPLVGPNSIILALMASGMNGQHFEFVGYLPLDNKERVQKIKSLEEDSRKNGSTKIFIETPYRNMPLIDTLLQSCKAHTQFCIAVDITGKNEFIKTKNVSDWKKSIPQIHKQPAIFLLHAGRD